MPEQLVDNHKLVQVTYSITDESGDVLEQLDLPVGYVHGAGSTMLPKVEQALWGNRCGETVTVVVSPEDAFGPHLSELTFSDDRSNVPEEFQIEGAEAQFQNDQGEKKTFRVTGIEGDKVMLDGNHPFAGKTLTYRLRIMTIRDATADEIRGASNGMIAPEIH